MRCCFRPKQWTDTFFKNIFVIFRQKPTIFYCKWRTHFYKSYILILVRTCFKMHEKLELVSIKLACVMPKSVTPPLWSAVCLIAQSGNLECIMRCGGKAVPCIAEK